MTKEEEIFLRILRESSNFDSTTLNNAIRIIYMYAFYHINSHNRFIPDSALKLGNILYYNHISYYFKNERRKLLWNSIDALFHTGSSLDRWISRCPTQTFITQENDWIFYTNARIVESCLAHRWPSSKRYFDISSTSPPRDCYKSEKRISLPSLPPSCPTWSVSRSFYPILFPFSFLPCSASCTPFYTLLLSICLPDSMQIGSDSKLMRVTGEEDIFVRNNAP